MDFADERYVRVYTRDTTTWRRLGWEGQCMTMQLLRRVDRAGVLDIEDMTPAEAAALHTGGPIEFVELGVAKMLELGVVEHRGTCLVFPRYLEAQETAKTDRARQRESREKRRDSAKSRSRESQNVTECHDRSHAVTARHSASQAVTPCCAVPFRTDPVPCVVSDEPSQNVTTSDLPDASAHARAIVSSSVQFERPTLPEPPPELEPPEQSLLSQIVTMHAREFVKRRNGETPPANTTAAKRLAEWCETNAAAHETTPVGLAKRVLEGLYGSDKAAQRRWPLTWAAYDPTEYVPAPPGAAPVPKLSLVAAAAGEPAYEAMKAHIVQVRTDFDRRIRDARGDDYAVTTLCAERDALIPRLEAKLAEVQAGGSGRRRS